MAPLSSDDPSSQRAVLRLQRDFLSVLNSAVKKPNMFKRNIKRLQTFFNNPYLDFNFEIDGLSPLSLATKKVRVLDELLRCENVDINFRAHDGRTCLFAAVQASTPDSLKLLIRNGALVNQKDNKGRSPLSLAAELGRYAHAEILVEADADISSADEQMYTPISWAISCQENEVLEYLLSRTVEYPTYKDCHDRTPLTIAAEVENIQGIWLLITAKKTSGGPFNESERSLLVWAVFRRDVRTVQLLLQADRSLVDQRVKGRTPLSMAAETGDVNIMKQLIDAGADPNAVDEKTWPPLDKSAFESYMPPGSILQEIEDFVSVESCQGPLHLAAKLNHWKALELLLESGADVNLKDTKGRTALTWAVDNRHLWTVESLLKAANIDVDCHDVHGQTPFAVAARLGELDILVELFDSGANINSEDTQQRTPLTWGITERQKKIVEFLLELPGIRVDQSNNQGRTPFSLAAELGLIAIMQLLLVKQADPHKADYHGHTAFWWFLKKRNDKLQPLLLNFADVNPDLQILINSLPTPNKKDQSGRNWLSWAASYGDKEVVAHFLQNGTVDVNIRDGTQESFSRTPLIWALEKEDKAMVDLLKESDNLSLHLLIEETRSIGQYEALRLMKVLIQADYNVNQRDSQGRTPLHLACLAGNEDIVLGMINAGADLSCKDHAGKIPLQYALGVRGKKIVQSLLNASSADLKPVLSDEWFNLEQKKPSWIQITKKINNMGFTFESVNGQPCHWLPSPKESRLCLCGQASIWSHLPILLGIRDIVEGQNRYFRHVHKELRHFVVTYLCLNFPEGQDYRAQSWGIAWVSKKTTEGLAHGFISMLPSGSMPHHPFDFFQQFLDHLYQEWKKFCLKLTESVEILRRDQVKLKGSGLDLIDCVAQGLERRAHLRRCLQSHIEGIGDIITNSSSFNLEQKSQLATDMDLIEQNLTSRLDHLEQSLRELLQIELAWVSTNESASVKRLSWLTFVFLPPMFVSSLFGMNVNLLENNPDWRWYILFGTLSLILTGALWLISKFLPRSLKITHSRKMELSEKRQTSLC